MALDIEALIRGTDTFLINYTISNPDIIQNYQLTTFVSTGLISLSKYLYLYLTDNNSVYLMDSEIYTNRSIFVTDALGSIVLDIDTDQLQPTLTAIALSLSTSSRMYAKSNVYIYVDAPASDLSMEQMVITQCNAWGSQVNVCMFKYMYLLALFYTIAII